MEWLGMKKVKKKKKWKRNQHFPNYSILKKKRKENSLETKLKLFGLE